MYKDRIQFKYNAFISYSHKDFLWAKRLKYGLDTFSSKKFSQKKHPLREVFLDKYNLSVDDLKDKGIPENLQYSNYLICLCTKNYSSEWIELEISEYKRICSERGNNWKEFVIPIIIGENVDVLPKSLHGIKAIIINNTFTFLQKEFIIAQIASKILCIANPNDIYNYLYKKFVVKLCWLILLIFVLCLCGIGIWEFSRTKYKYYEDYIEGCYVKGDQTEWLQGIGELPLSSIDSIKACFRFEYKRISLGQPQVGRWQLQTVVHQNVFGNPIGYEERTTPFTRYPILRIRYQYINSKYRPERIECYNEYNKLQRIKQISGDNLDKIDFKNFKTDLAFNNQTLEEFSDPLLERLGNKYCNITHFDLVRDSEGNVNGVIFKSSNGIKELPMPDTRKHISISLSTDSIGRIIQANYVKNDMKVDYSVGYGYEDFKLVRKTLSSKEDLVQSIWYKFVNNNYIKKYIYTQKDTMYRSIEYTFDNGVLIKKRKSELLGEKNISFIVPKQFVIWKNIKYTYNQHGYPILETYLYEDDSIKYFKSIDYNVEGMVLCVKYFVLDINNKPIFINGPENYKYVYNEYNNEMLDWQHYYSTHGEYYIHYEYDKYNRLLAINYYNDKRELCNLGEYGSTIACDNYEADILTDLQELIKEKESNKNRLFDNDTICCLKWKFPFGNNYARREFTYDDMGNIIKIRYYNDKKECFIVIEEDILENGLVPFSIGYITNKKGQKFPLRSVFYTASDTLSPLEHPITKIIIENMFADEEKE